MVDPLAAEAQATDAAQHAASVAAAAEAGSITDLPETAWFMLDPNNQHVGPYDVTQMQEWYSSGVLPPETLCWRPGRNSWKPSKDIPEFQSAEGAQQQTVRQTANAVETASSAAADLAAAAAAAAPTPSSAGTAGASISAAPAKLDPLAVFNAEISEIEAENQAAEQPPSPEDKSFVDDDGTAYDWDPKARRFVESGTTAAAPVNYDVADMTFAGEEEPIPPMPALPQDSDDEEEAAADANESKRNGNGANKRKLEEAVEREKAKKQKAKDDAEKKAQWFELQQNSSVYITGLPLDVTEAELARVFTKCGVIKLDDERQPRVKVYRDADGTPKGDGLVTYLKTPSVDLALQILDGAQLRDGDSKPLTVTKARFEQKGDFVPKKRGTKKKKKKVLEKQEERELGWGGFDDVAPPTKTTVVLKHMFHPDEFLEDFTLREQLEDDVTGEAAKLGKVEKVKIFNTNPEGVLTVKFREEGAAQKCIELMHGRFFGGRKLEATFWDGIQNFHVKVPKPSQAETAEEQQARLEKFAAELEAA